jgi:hypothetical protein
MPRIIFPCGPGLLAKIARPTGELGILRGKYLANLIWRDIGQAAEKKTKRKLLGRKGQS